MAQLPRRILLVMVLALAWGEAVAAPPLSDAERQQVRDFATDGDGQIDGNAAFYALLSNARGWAVDDFSGEGGAAVAPKPDYGFLRDKPVEARGSVFLIEGVFEQQVRYPTGDQKLQRSGSPEWGDRVTRWAIRTSDDPDSTVLVFFNDPDASIQPPKPGEQVRVAARFYKVWATENQAGEPFSFPVFVGGAREVLGKPARVSFGSNRPMQSIVIALIVACIAAFFVVRFLLNRKAGEGAGGRTQAYLDQRRRERQLHEMDEEEEHPEDLPADPAEAMEVLRRQHEED